MKTILKIILIFTALISISCDNMYNDLAYEIVAEYDYFLAVGAGSNIRIYSIDSNGTPNSVYNQSIGVGASIRNIAVHPSGKYLYVPDTANDIFYVYQVNNDGSLTNIDSLSTGASTAPYGVKVDPTGKYVYVSYSNISSNKIGMFSIGVNGKLTSLGTVSILTPVSSGPQLIDFNPSGKNIYVTLNSGGGFTAFKVDNNGFLFSPVTINISTGPYGLIVHPNGKYIYVSDRSSSNIFKYNLFSDGTVDSGSQSVYSVGNNSNAMSIHPNGSFMYIKHDFNGNIFAYKINDNGSLTYSNQTPDQFTGGTFSLIVHPNAKYIYLTETGGNRLYFNFILNSDGLFNQNYSYINISNGASSKPAIIRRRKVL